MAISTLNPSKFFVGARGIEYVVFYNSADGANSFEIRPIGTSLNLNVSYIVVDPQNPATAYRGLNDSGFRQSSLQKTTDGGESWMPVYDRNAGFDTSNLSLVINPQNSNILFNIVRDDLDRKVFTNKSTDGGSTWSTITDPILTGLIAIDPSNIVNFYSIHNGLYKSTNGGESWQLTSLPSTISTLTIDPTDSLTLYAGNVIPNPAILSVSIEGKNLIITGTGFHAGVIVKIDSEMQKTKRDANRPNEVLICKKAAKKIAPGQKVSITVQEIDGASATFDFTR